MQLKPLTPDEVADRVRTLKERLRPGLGDMVAAGLSAVGITKERVQAVANAVGIKDCGCAKRQAALTKLGRKFGIG
jgi:hypothetical protein